MWLSNSSVGRKMVMALTGAFLVLFVTFHCLMNAVAICWPAAYNSVCEFLGANWYALAASAVLAIFILIHIIYAVMLTVQNRKARGSERYAISKKPASVEWSSQNMLVLGIVVLAFLVVHLIQFWAKMQLEEIVGGEGIIPPAAGTLFLQEAFSQPWTLVVYAIGFLALWFHLNHGFWSMFQSIGWNNANWINRLKKIGLWWTTIVIALFFAEGIVFTVKANEKFYLTDETLRDQYKDMMIPEMAKELGPDAAQFEFQMSMLPYDQVSNMVKQNENGLRQALEQVPSPEFQAQLKANPQMAEQVEAAKEQLKVFEKATKFLNYIESADDKPNTTLPAGMGGQPY